MNKTPQTDLTAALDNLWTRFLPEIQERVAILESAVRSLDMGSFPAEQREAALSAAHKLAGVLGTFSLHRGTELARAIELIFSGDGPGAHSIARLGAMTAELRAVIDSRT